MRLKRTLACLEYKIKYYARFKESYLAYLTFVIQELVPLRGYSFEDYQACNYIYTFAINIHYSDRTINNGL